MARDDAWLQDVLIDGLQMLLALRLRDAPPADTITVTLDAWLLVFRSRPMRWDKATSPQRLRQAFLNVAAKAERWPTPAQVLGEYPTPPRAPQLPPPDSNMPEHIREQIAQLKRQFTEKTGSRREPRRRS